MKKVKITLKGGGALEWTPRNQTRNILGLWNWMSRTQNESAILNFEEGGVRLSEIAAMEPIEVPSVELSYFDDEQEGEEEKVASRYDDKVQEYREITGIVYAVSEEPFTDINNFPRFDVYPSLTSLIVSLGYHSQEEELISNGFIFAEVTCRVPLSEFKRFEEGNWVLVNRGDVVSEDIRFEESYELKPGHVGTWHYLTLDNREETVTVYAKKPDGIHESLRYHQVYSLVPVMSSTLEEFGMVVVPCYHVTPKGSEDS